MRQQGHAILLGTGEEATEGIRFQHIPSCKGIQQNLLQNPVPAQGEPHSTEAGRKPAAELCQSRGRSSSASETFSSATEKIFCQIRTKRKGPFSYPGSIPWSREGRIHTYIPVLSYFTDRLITYSLWGDKAYALHLRLSTTNSLLSDSCLWFSRALLSTASD